MLLILGALGAYLYLNLKNSSSTSFKGEQKHIFISSGTTFEALSSILFRDSIVSDTTDFSRLAGLKKFSSVKPGRYLIAKGKSHNAIINQLRIGNQDPVRVVIRGQRLPADMAGTISSQLEADSSELLSLLTSEAQASKYGFNLESFRTMILPNTYQFNWNTSAEEVISRMAKEYKSFWTSDRIARANQLGLSQSEVSTLASIVKAETAKSDEAPKVAGLYLNRLKKGMALQADPTLIYALGDFTIKRVLDKHKLVESKYNTYKHSGLPPGPINYPETNYLDAVLNPVKHKYLYMCARPDFSGYHDFSKTYNQHLNYAHKYHEALRRNGIYR